MAEERLIDDDKDRKYKIRINENGEEELVIVENPDEEDKELPVLGGFAYEDDEEAVDITPEQLAERKQLKEQEEKARAEKVQSLIDKAKSQIKEGDFEAALYSLNLAEELDGKCGELYCLKLKTLTRGFTDFNSPDQCEEVAEGVRQYASAESKAELAAQSDGLKARMREVGERTESLKEENEKGKEERRYTFACEKTKALINFLGTAVPLFIFAVMAIIFANMMFAAENGAYLIATIVFAGLVLISLIATLISGHKLWSALRKVKLNEKDTSTKIGREYLESKKEFDRLNNIYSCLSDDIS